MSKERKELQRKTLEGVCVLAMQTKSTESSLKCAHMFSIVIILFHNNTSIRASGVAGQQQKRVNTSLSCGYPLSRTWTILSPLEDLQR